MSKVFVQIVTWNSMRYIFDCMESLVKQEFRDFSIMIIDNGSDDGTVEFIRSNYPTVSVLQNFRNLGFSKANNQGILLAKSEYVLVVNPDVILTPDFLENIVSFADTHLDAASFSGKILKAASAAIDDTDQAGLRQAVMSPYIDSTGLLIFKSRRAVNRGENQKDEGQYNRANTIFGVSGACALYRRAGLTDVMIKNEIFDNDFFAYKEDVDLAWRLQLYGYSAWYVPSAVCYHYRRLAMSSDQRLIRAFKHRQTVSPRLRSLSFRNQHLMLVKNDYLVNIILTAPWFITQEIKVLLFSLFAEPFQYKSVISFFKLLPTMFIKRGIIMAHRKMSACDIRKWLT